MCLQQVYVHLCIYDDEETLLYSTRSSEGGSGQAYAFLYEKGTRVPRAWELALRGSLWRGRASMWQLLFSGSTCCAAHRHSSAADTSARPRACMHGSCVSVTLISWPAAGMVVGQRCMVQAKPQYGFRHPECRMEPPSKGIPTNQARAGCGHAIRMALEMSHRVGCYEIQCMPHGSSPSMCAKGGRKLPPVVHALGTALHPPLIPSSLPIYLHAAFIGGLCTPLTAVHGGQAPTFKTHKSAASGAH